MPYYHVWAGVAYFVLFALGLPWLLPTIANVWQGNPWALLETHLFTLGFVTSVYMGGIFLLITGPLGGVIWRPTWMPIQFGLYVIGMVTLLVGFVLYNAAWLIPGGTLVGAAVGLFLINALRSLRSATQPWSGGPLLKWALFYLAIVVLMGLALAANVGFGYLKGATRSHLIMHAVQGFGGWFSLGALALVAGFSGVTLTRIRPALWLMNLGLLLHVALVGFAVPGWSLAVCVVLFGTGALLVLRDLQQWGAGRTYIVLAGGALMTALILSCFYVLLPWSGFTEARGVALILATGLGWIVPLLLSLAGVDRRVSLLQIAAVGTMVLGLWWTWIWVAVVGAGSYAAITLWGTQQKVYARSMR